MLDQQRRVILLYYTKEQAEMHNIIDASEVLWRLMLSVKDFKAHVAGQTSPGGKLRI